MKVSELFEARVKQIAPQGADYSSYKTEDLKNMLNYMHRDEQKFKTLIRQELRAREKLNAEFKGKTLIYKEYRINQDGPFQWSVPDGTKLTFKNLAAAKKYIDKQLITTAESSTLDSNTYRAFKRDAHTGRLNAKPEDDKPTGRYAARLARYAKEREERENKPPVKEELSRDKLEKMIANLEQQQDDKTKTTTASGWVVADRIERLKTRLKNLDEGWKDNVASAAVVGGLTTAIGSMVAVNNSMPITHIDGREFMKHELPSNMSDVKIKTDDNGNKVYAWVEKAGMKPNYTYYWYSPVNKK